MGPASPAPDVQAGNSIYFSVRVHNPSATTAYPTLQAAPRGDLQLSGDTTHSVTLGAGGWSDVGWQASQLRTGGSGVILSILGQLRYAGLLAPTHHIYSELPD